jgi:hypothetical protein
VTLTIRHKKEFRGPFDNTANHTESTNDTGAYQLSSEPTKAELLGLLMAHHPVADFKLSREGGILPDVLYHSRKLLPIQQSSATQQDDVSQLGDAIRHMEVSLRSGLDGVPPHAYTHLWFDPATGGYKPPVTSHMFHATQLKWALPHMGHLTPCKWSYLRDCLHDDVVSSAW